MALSRLTKDVVGGSFTRNTRIAFGHGCDHPNYVGAKYNFIQAICNDNLATNTNLANSPLVSQITFANNGITRMTTTKTYDYLNRLTSISSVGGASSTSPISSFNYNYNSANQRTRADIGGASSTSPTYWVYQYERLCENSRPD